MNPGSSSSTTATCSLRHAAALSNLLASEVPHLLRFPLPVSNITSVMPSGKIYHFRRTLRSISDGIQPLPQHAGRENPSTSNLQFSILNLSLIAEQDVIFKYVSALVQMLNARGTRSVLFLEYLSLIEPPSRGVPGYPRATSAMLHARNLPMWSV